MDNLADLLEDGFAQYEEAERLKRRALAIDENSYGEQHPSVAIRLGSLASVLNKRGRVGEAEPLYRRALAIDERSYGAEHPYVATDLGNLANLLGSRNQIAEAEELDRRALAIHEKSLGPDHPRVATALGNLGLLLKGAARFDEAERLYRRALAIQEKNYGAEHPNVAIVLSYLAGLFQDTYRLAEAEQLQRRALAMDEKSLGPEHPDVARHLVTLGALLQNNHQLEEAEPVLRRALAIHEKSLGASHHATATDRKNLAEVLKGLTQTEEAAALFKRALADDEKNLGPEHPIIAVRLNDIALLLQDTGHTAEAEPLLRRALDITGKALGTGHPHYAIALDNLARARAEQGAWADAVALHRKAKPILIARKDANDTDRTGLAAKTLAQNSWILRQHTRALFRSESENVDVREEAYELAQWALQTSAGQALAQMAARVAGGSGTLADLVRKRQQLLQRRQIGDQKLIAAVGNGQLDVAKDLRELLAAQDGELDALDGQVASNFQQYARLANPTPLGIAATQALLKDDEAILLFLDVARWGSLPEQSLAWLVTKTDARWWTIRLGTRALASEVSALRCGLDGTLWDATASADKCAAALKASPTVQEVDGQRVQVLPFDFARAHSLYRTLFGPAEDLITGKSLLIVPSGSLTSLPFGALLTAPAKLSASPGLSDYRAAAWLGTRQPITILPSIASLQALRQLAKTSQAKKPYLGIGNPLLDGVADDAGDAQRAARARSKQVCPKATFAERMAMAAAARPLSSFAKVFRGAHADIEEVRQWSPLPETADELCEIGRRLGVREEDVLLASHATESALKQLSEKGTLADYRILHFATHGALSGQVEGLSEPGLVLTPPGKGTNDPNALDRDDGFLTASEIAALKLDADWVILSACNTAGGQDESAEALSGMARAFFYAGARALLVSHWAVGSEAAVKLTTHAFAELKADRKIGRAEAFRRSMLELTQKSTLVDAHPSMWAPFVVVGEGGL